MRTCFYILLMLYVLPQYACEDLLERYNLIPNRITIPLISKSDTSPIEKNNTLIAFIGEKIEAQSLRSTRGTMDVGIRAKYKVLVNVYGNYPKNTIEFKAFDHFGLFEFLQFKHVLLFVSEYKGKYYHEKYQYVDVYKTKTGRWASSYKPWDYKHVYNQATPVKPEIIDFAERVVYPKWKVREDGSKVTFSYPAPYYKSDGDSVIAIYGNYLKDLFTLKKTGALAARGLFDVTPKQAEAEILATISSEDSSPLKDDPQFKAFWKYFATSVKQPDLAVFKRIALDSINVCGQLFSTNNFIDKCFAEVFDDEVMKRVGKSTGKAFTWSHADSSYMHSNALKVIIKVDDDYRFRQVLVARKIMNRLPPKVRFDFIETKNGYRLYGIDHHWYKECCK